MKKIKENINRKDISGFDWKLDVSYSSIDRELLPLLMAADTFAKHRVSCRDLERKFHVSKSRVHSFMADGRLETLSQQLYIVCKERLQWNKQHSQYFKDRNRDENRYNKL